MQGIRAIAAVSCVLAVACGGPQIRTSTVDLAKHAPATLEARTTRPGDARVAKLRVWVDPGVRAMPRWKDEIGDQIDYASQFLTPLLGARLEVVEWKEWARTGQPGNALRELAELDKGDGVTWVIGYIAPGDTAAKAISELGAM